MGYTINKEKFAFGQHKVRADIFTGSLVVFTRRSPPPKADRSFVWRGRKEGVWGGNSARAT